MLRRYRGPLGLFFLSAFLGLAPLLIALTAGMVAEMHGCILHEGYSNPCVILGGDRGEILYALGVFGWLGLMTIPFGAFGCLAALLWSIGRGLGEWRKRRATNVKTL